MLKINFKKFNKREEGFTLVETLVAVSIFSVSVVALMVVLGKGIADSNYAKKKIIAENLAQEGVESLRNIRDNTVLFAATGQVGWNSFIANIGNSACNNTGSRCYVNDSLILVSCGGQCPEMRYDSSTGRYGYSGSLSGFRRTITAVTDINNEVKISSLVTWSHAGVNYSVTLSETLFNWMD